MSKDLKYDLILMCAQTVSTIVVAGAVLALKVAFDRMDDRDVGINGLKKHKRNYKKDRNND